MQILPRSAPRRALRSSSNVSPASLSYGSYYNPSPRAPFVCFSCRRSRPQPGVLQQPRRSFSATVSRRSSSSSSSSPPLAEALSKGYAELKSRRLISVAGRDAPRFLQGILTASIAADPAHGRNGRSSAAAARNVVEAHQARADAFYGGVLNAMGRVLHDVFVYPETRGLYGGGGGGAAFVVEVDAAQLENLMRHMRRYKLRSVVDLRALPPDEAAVWQVWGQDPPPPPPPPFLPSESSPHVVLRDPRAPEMGFRVLKFQVSSSSSSSGMVDEAVYRARRYLLGVPEGQAEIPPSQALPLEANMDLMGGIDFRKGCYIGQELTIRTRHRGVVRKRVLPCMLYNYTSSSSSSSSSTTTSQQPPQHLEYKPGPLPISGDVGQEGKGEGEGEGEGKERALSAEDIPAGLSIGRVGKKGRSAGTWIAGVGNIGLALCRLNVMTDVELPGEPVSASADPFDPATHEFVMHLDGADADADGGERGRSVRVKAFVPDWLRERLSGGGGGGGG
ncbi:Aminomethyltransferase folate-binding domain-containing protein [Biscogniauxia marginata]|nr:Aminomethyltransferase folate-binding domain-containing protein [Biscogniauxia marginata]